MSEWKEYKLKDICLKITDGSHKSPKAQSSGYPMFSVKDMEEYGFNYNDCKLISSEDFAEMKSTGCVPEKDDILIAKDGSYLKQIFICKESREEAILSSIAIFRPDKNIIEPRFLMYLLKSPQVFNYIKTNCVSGSAIPRIVLKSFKDVSMRVPESLTEQKRISNFLEDIDDKIAVNRRICENLEAQAQALFKHWFIDFAPFKNGKFVESELGMIPEGWRVGTLEDLGKIICGKTPSKANKSYYGSDIPFIKIPDMHENVYILKSEDNLSIEGSNSQLNKMIPEFSIMVSCIATVGLVAMNVKPSHTNQQINTIVPFQSCYRYYVYENLKLRYKELLMLGSSGTTTYNVNTRTFSSLKILVPELRVIEDFNNVIKSHFEKILNLYQESTRLSTLRDTLLPKLMSGQIKVNEMEKSL